MLPAQNAVSRLSRGFRTGIVLGLAIAALGIAVGTVTGATTPFQQVVVVNAPASPIPVVGTVNVGNTPANQNVTVSNFPTTQPVSGSVGVTNKVTKVYQKFVELDHDTLFDFDLGGVINASMLSVIDEGNDDELIIHIKVNGETILITQFNSVREDFTLPVPITNVYVRCFNQVLSCDPFVTVMGY